MAIQRSQQLVHSHIKSHESHYFTVPIFPSLSLSAYPQVSLWQASTHAPQEVPFFLKSRLFLLLK